MIDIFLFRKVLESYMVCYEVGKIMLGFSMERQETIE